MNLGEILALLGVLGNFTILAIELWALSRLFNEQKRENDHTRIIIGFIASVFFLALSFVATVSLLTKASAFLLNLSAYIFIGNFLLILFEFLVVIVNIFNW